MAGWLPRVHSSAAPTKRRACVRACVCGLIIDCMHRFDGSVRAKCGSGYLQFKMCDLCVDHRIWLRVRASRALPLCMWQPPNGSRVYDNVGRTMTVGHMGAHVQHTMPAVAVHVCHSTILHNAYANVLRLELHKSATRYIVQYIIGLLFGFFK